MTTAAITAKTILMGIVLSMTGHAIGGRRCPQEDRFRMAGCTFDSFVGTHQRKVGHYFVVEQGQPPTSWVMAILAGRTERTLVGIIGCVAVATTTRYSMKHQRRVAPITVEFSVFAD